jgi:hypothetical protein
MVGPCALSNSPKYLELLSPADQKQYNELRVALSSRKCRNCRGRRLDAFADVIESVRSFCVRNDDDDWKRCLVCGICWLPNAIAICNRRLSILTHKCKSSINGSLQLMRYGTHQTRFDTSAAVIAAMPKLRDIFSEFREWTVRIMETVPSPPNTTDIVPVE